MNTTLMLLAYLAKFAGGFGFGYLSASLIESFVHQHVSDAPPKRVKQWQQHPRLLKYLIRTNYSHHVIHHRKTFRRDHITQFCGVDEQEALNELLAELGNHGEIIKRSKYAIKLHGSGSLVFAAPLLPMVPVCYLLAGRWATLGACLALSLPPLLSNYVHPYLHMRHRDAVKQAPAWLAVLLRTSYFRMMARHHYLHHRYVACNFNLLLGGDWLRRVSRQPGELDMPLMKALGLRLD